MVRKRSLIFLAILILSPVCLCVASLGYIFAYNHIGRITDFRSVSDGFQIPNTVYTVRVTRIDFNRINSVVENVYELALQNGETQNRFEIGRWSSCGHYCLPDFTFLSQKNNTYFVIKYPGHDSIHYQIFNISGNSPETIASDDSNHYKPFRSVYAACTYPKLGENMLIFEYDFDCDAYPILADIHSYEVELQ